MAEGREHGGNEEFILDLISQGLSHTEIRKRVAERKKEKEIGIEKGKKSEEFAAETMLGIDMVKKVFILPGDSKENKWHGKDLRVDLYLKKARSYYKRHFQTSFVWVQVKSTDKAVSYFRRTNGNNEEERDQALAKRRLIVLNGRNSKENITKSFIHQLDYIDKYKQQKR